MTEYEMVREIKNQCPNNQMRDIFFDEVECDDPESYVRSILRGTEIELTTDHGSGGQVTVHAAVDGIAQRFVFTPI